MAQRVQMLLVVVLVAALTLMAIRIRARRPRSMPNLRRLPQAPAAIASLSSILPVNADILLYSGLIEISTPLGRHSCDADLTFKWLPHPRIALEATAARSLFEHDLVARTATTRTSLWSDCDFLITGVQFDSTRPTLRIRGVADEELRRPIIPASAASGGFHLVNFLNYHGSRVADTTGQVERYDGRMSFETSVATVFVDKRPDLRNILEEARAIGGYAISHTIRWECLGSATLTLDQQDELMDILRYMFAFMGGLQVGPILPFNLLDGSLLRATSYNVGSAFANRTWFPLATPQAVSSMCRVLDHRLRDTVWQSSLRFAIDWYVDASRHQYSEAALIKACVALESLVWFVLVDRRRVIAKSKYESISLADKLRKLLGLLDIPTGIPAHLQDLTRAAIASQLTDGPHVVVRLRNMLVHSTRAKQAKVASSFGTIAKYEAKELALQYVELILLALLEYTGQYSDRTNLQTDVWASTPVPWV